MRLHKFDFRQAIAAFTICLLTAPAAHGAGASGQQEIAAQQTQSVPAPSAQAQDSGSAGQNAQTAASQAGPDQSQNSPTKPVGTAAAPLETTSGVAASRPAGAVIAPAKQKRARAILIRVSIVVGAAVAVGTVVALSRASPARPN
jgi:hypothetical protein